MHLSVRTWSLRCGSQLVVVWIYFRLVCPSIMVCICSGSHYPKTEYTLSPLKLLSYDTILVRSAVYSTYAVALSPGSRQLFNVQENNGSAWYAKSYESVTAISH